MWKTGQFSILIVVVAVVASLLWLPSTETQKNGQCQTGDQECLANQQQQEQQPLPEQKQRQQKQQNSNTWKNPERIPVERHKKPLDWPEKGLEHVSFPTLFRIPPCWKNWLTIGNGIRVIKKPEGSIPTGSLVMRSPPRLKIGSRNVEESTFIQANPDFAGYEIWCNILSPMAPLSYHVDKDQLAYQESDGQNVSSPLYGSVFYGYVHDFEGGLLEILPYDPYDVPTDMEHPDPDEIERIQAEYNRLILFNATKFHRVSPIARGHRVTLAVNVWKGLPSFAALSTDS
jgi:hypothetical protein